MCWASDAIRTWRHRRAGGPGDRGHSRVHGSRRLQECVGRQRGGAMVISAGFGELAQKPRTRTQVRESWLRDGSADRAELRGVMNPSTD